MKFFCLHCDQCIEATDELAGKTIDCPNCQRNIAVPFPEHHIAAPDPEAKPAISVAQKIDEQAQDANNAARFCAVMTCLSMVLIVFGATVGGLSGAGFFFILYLANKILAQLLHIRALLYRQIIEKQ